MLIIGHRGSSGTAPENTLSAFKQAFHDGVNMVELDVQLTCDHQLVVIHDETLDRTTNGSGYVKNHTLAQIQALDAGKWFHEEYKGESVPTLKQVLQILPDEVLVNIELKNNLLPYPGLEKEVVQLVKELNCLNRVIISSFNHSSLAVVNSIEPRVSTGLLFQEPMEVLTVAQHLAVRTLHPHYSLLTSELVSQAHALGYPIYTWTVNAQEQMWKMKDLGVDGIMTNYPPLAMTTLR